MTDLSPKLLLLIKAKPLDNLVSRAHSVVGRRPINRKRSISLLASYGSAQPRKHSLLSPRAYALCILTYGSATASRAKPAQLTGIRPINNSNRGNFPASRSSLGFHYLHCLFHYNIYDFLRYVDLFDYVACEFVCDCSFSGF